MEWIGIGVIIFISFFVEVVFGFGGGLIAIPLTSLLIAPKDAVLLFLVMQCYKSGMLAWIWRDIHWKSIKLLPIGLIIGATIGVTLLEIIPPDALRIFLALYLIFFVTGEHIKLGLKKLKANNSNSTFFGFLGGIISGTIGMGGPALVTYLKIVELNKDAFRATIVALLTFLNLYRLILDFPDVISNPYIQTFAVPGLIGFFAIHHFARHIPKFISEKRFKSLIDILLLISAAMLIAKAVF